MPRVRFAVLAFLTFALPLVAQNAPPPPPPPAPFTGFLGRFLDSSSTLDFQGMNRTLRADAIKFDRARDRLYMRAGGGYFLGYRLSTFISRLGSPLATAAHREKYLPFEMSVNAEAIGSDWQTTASDGQLRLRDFDFDARGYIYLAYSLFGFGIVDLQGHLIKQIVLENGDPVPRVAVTFPSGGQQYLIVSDGDTASVLWDVTDPANPQRVRSLGFGIASYAKNAAGDAIAIVVPGATTLRIYSAAALFSNGAPTLIQHNTSFSATTNFQFRFVTSDGEKFYAEQEGIDTSQSNTLFSIISTVAPFSQSYTSSEMSPMLNKSAVDLRFESGYLTFRASYFTNGFPPAAATLFRFDGTNFVAYSIDSYLQSIYYTTGFKYVEQIVPLCTDAGAFALFAAIGVGDVFGLSPAVWPCLPGAPRDVTATADSASATVSFSPPSSDGGSPITSYKVTSNPGGVTVGGASSPVTVPGLTNNVTYTFTVTATNGAGVGPASLPSNAATPAATLLPPALMQATATGTSAVSVNWSAAAHAVRYEVLRSSMGAPFSVVASRTGFNYVDTAVVPDTTYLYRVRSVDATDTLSAETPTDRATTLVFTNDPLTAGQTVQALHINQLRTAVNAMRVTAGKDNATSTDQMLDAGTIIKAAHLMELRSALEEARSAIGLTLLSYTDSTITPGVTTCKVVHVQELRDAVK